MAWEKAYNQFSENRVGKWKGNKMGAARLGLGEQKKAEKEMMQENMRLQAADDPMMADLDAANESMQNAGGSENTGLYEQNPEGDGFRPKVNPASAADPGKSDITQAGDNLQEPGLAAANQPMNQYGQEDMGKGNMPSSIIMDENGKPKAPPEATPEQQDSIAVMQQQAIQNAQATQRMEEEISNKKSESFKGELVSGVMARVLKTLPGVTALLAKFKKASPETMLKLLQKLRTIIVASKKVTGFGEGLVRYAEVFVALIGTIIIPILMILILPFYIVFLAMFPETFSTLARTMNMLIKRIDRFLVQIKKIVDQKKKKKSLKARLENLRKKQLDVASRPASNEPIQQSQQKAA